MAKITDRFIFRELEFAMNSDCVLYITGPANVGKNELVDKIIGSNYSQINMREKDYSKLSKINPRAFIRSLPPYVLLRNIDGAYHLANQFSDLVYDLRVKYRGYLPNIFALVSSVASIETQDFSGRFQVSARNIFISPLMAAESIPFGDVSFIHNIFHKKYFNAKIDNSHNLEDVIYHATFPDLLSDKKKDEKYFFNNLISKFVRKNIEDEKIAAKFPEYLKLIAENIGNNLSEKQICNELKITRKEFLNLSEYVISSNFLFRLDQWSQASDREDLTLTYLIDTNLTRHILKEDSIMDSEYKNQLLYNFVASELFKQTTLTKEYKLYHFQKYKDCKVDFIIENQSNGEIVPINIIFSENLDRKDIAEMESFKSYAHQSCERGIILYMGEKVINFRDNNIALPIASLWYSGDC